MGVNSKGADQVMIEDQDTTISWLKTINRLSAFEIGELEAKIYELEKSRHFHINSVAKVVEDSRTIIEELEADKKKAKKYIKTLVDKINELEKHKPPDGAICFEITETAAISNLSRVVKFMQTLKKLGCKFSLDDFGTGLSSFSYLKTLNVD